MANPILVTFNDVTHQSDWESIRKDYTQEVVLAECVGWRLPHKDRRFLVLTTMRDKKFPTCFTRLIIPRGMIISITELKEASHE